MESRKLERRTKHVFKLVALLFCFFIAQAGFAQQQWSVGYWTPWGNPSLPPSQIEWAGLTHVVYWGGLVQSDGSLDLTTQLVTTDGPTLIATAHAHGVKVLLGLLQGNWVGQTDTLQPATTQNLSRLVTNVMNAVNTYGFDGVDIDWEPFDPATNGSAMKQLASALRAQLGTRVLTTAVIVNHYAYWGTVQSYFDRVQMMTYDLTGTWNPYSWHNAAVYHPSDNMVWSLDMAVQRFVNAGTPASKLSIGIPFYGWQWSGGGITGPQQYWSSTPSLGQIYYQRLVSKITSSNYRWDSSAQVPYLSITSGSGEFITYDNEQSVADKVNYAKNLGLGGWIIWELCGDYLPTQTPKQPLLAAIKNAMGTVTMPPSITTSSLPNATQSTAYSTTLAAVGGAQPYTWSISSGSLPAGLALASSTGVISGVPSTTGTSSFTVKVSDAAAQSATQVLSITVNAAPPPTTSGPFALWTLDATTGSSASDSSGNNNTVILSNGPVWSSGTNCMINECLSFNGTNQAGTASLNLSDTNVITVAFWMNWNAYSSNDSLAMESTPNFNHGTTGFMVDPNSSQGDGTQFEAGLQGDAGYNQVLFARPSAGAWHHYAIVFNKGAAAGSQVTPYVDGVAVGYTKPTSAQNTNNFGADSFYLMSRAAASLFGAGKLDDVRIYKRALSASEILSLATVAAPTATPPPSITTSSLPDATQSTAYSTTLAATGGTQPYTWSVSLGSLPAGLALASSTGVISGVPTTTGTSSFTVRVSDSTAQSATQALSLTVNASTSTSTSGPFVQWKLDESSGSSAFDSSGNNNTATLSNGPVWSSGADCMINGCLSFNGTNQAASATLNLSDTNVITVAFWMNWNGYSSNDSLAMESTPNFNNGTTGFMVDPNSSQGDGTQFEAGLRGDAGYNQVLFARPSAGAWHHYAFVFNKGAAAASQVTPYVDGLAVEYTKPTSAQNTNNFGADSLYLMSRAASSLFGAGKLDDVRIYQRALSASEVLTLATVIAPSSASSTAVSITTTSLPNAIRNTPYSTTLIAAGGASPYTWSVVSGTLPAGLTLVSSTGVISGTPTKMGTSSFTIGVTDSKSQTATQALSITVRQR